jgi:hypothetical protein
MKLFRRDSRTGAPLVASRRIFSFSFSELSPHAGSKTVFVGVVAVFDNPSIYMIDTPLL